MNRTRAAIALGLVALVVAVFAQVRDHSLVDYDDLIHIVQNPYLSPGPTWRGAIEALTTPNHTQWMPLTRISFQVNYGLHGYEPAGYLIGNVALHAAASVVLFLTLAAMTGAMGASAFVAAVFAVHPLHVESVAWASERKDALAGFMWMVGMAAYWHYTRGTSPGRYAALLLATCLGLLSKPSFVTFPFALLLLDYWPLKRLDRRAVVEKLPLVAMVVAVSVITMHVQFAAKGAAHLEGIPLDLRIANALNSYVVYIGDSFWPSGLAAFYPHPQDSLSPLRVAACAALLVGLTAGAWTLRGSRPHLLVGWLWFLGILVPTIGLIQVGSQARADRYMYLPLQGLTLALAWEVRRYLTTPLARHVATAVAATGVCALAVVAWKQVGVWHDSITLFEHNLMIEPNAVYPHSRLGVLRLRIGELDRAEYHYRMVYEMDADGGRYNMVRFLLGKAELEGKRGNVPRAMELYREAVEVDPDYDRANGLLGLALAKTGAAVEARPYLERALKSRHEARLLAALGYSHLAAGRAGPAISRTREALEVEPDLPSARNNLAWLLAVTPDPALREPEEAVRLAERLLAETPEPSGNLFETVAVAYAAAGRFEEATDTALRGVEAANAVGDSAQASVLRERAEQFRAGQPYVDPSLGEVGSGNAEADGGTSPPDSM